MGADASLPLSIVPVGPISAPFNRLDLEYLSGPLVEGKTYGISASIIVPRNSPTSSANVFTIQIGDGEAAVAAAPAVQAVVGADISYQSSIAGATNLVCARRQFNDNSPWGVSVPQLRHQWRSERLVVSFQASVVAHRGRCGWNSPGPSSCQHNSLESGCAIASSELDDSFASEQSIDAGFSQFSYRIPCYDNHARWVCTKRLLAGRSSGTDQLGCVLLHSHKRHKRDS